MPETVQAAAALTRRPEVQAALRAIEAGEPGTLADMRRATAIPAPYRGEAERGRWLAERFRQLGLPAVRTDSAGNVLAGADAGDVGAAIVLAAHLDTVFPPDTALEPQLRGDRVYAPGIADNGRGLAALLRLAAVLTAAPLTARPVLFVGTVGEEGAGDLRGVKYLFQEQGLRPAAFIAVDGAGMARVIHRAVGSRRYRVRLAGPGGHSWSDRTQLNPVHVLAGVIAELESLRREAGEDVALNVGRIAGGTSVNAIPQSVWLELDVRAESPATLAGLDARVRLAFEQMRLAPLELTVELMGERPAGSTPAGHPLVRAAAAATQHLGAVPELTCSSTDANVPMALGIPAIALGAGGEAGGLHTLEEWYRNERGAAGIQRLLLTLVLADSLL